MAIEERIAAHAEEILGSDRPDTLRAYGTLAYSYWRAGRTKQAIAIEECIAADMERILGADHPDTLTARYNLPASYAQPGRRRMNSRSRTPPHSQVPGLATTVEPSPMVARPTVGRRLEPVDVVGNGPTCSGRSPAGVRLLHVSPATSGDRHGHHDVARGADRSRRGLAQ